MGSLLGSLQVWEASRHGRLELRRKQRRVRVLAVALLPGRELRGRQGSRLSAGNLKTAGRTRIQPNLRAGWP